MGAKTSVVAEDLSNSSLFDETIIRKILMEIEIDPDRAVNAKLNSIFDKNRQLLLAANRNDTCPTPEILILSSQKTLETTKIMATR